MFAVGLILLSLASFVGIWQFFVIFAAIGEAVAFSSHPWYEYKRLMKPQVAWLRWFFGGFRK